MSFIYHKWDLLGYEKILILLLSRVLSCFLKLDLHGYSNYDDTPTFSDVTVYAIFASGYPAYISSLVIRLSKVISQC